MFGEIRRKIHQIRQTLATPTFHRLRYLAIYVLL